MKNKGCKERGCKNTHYARGICRAHYIQLPDVKIRQRGYAEKYYMKNMEKAKSRAAKYAKDNPERVKEVCREWYKRNRESHIAKAKKRYHDNKKKGVAV